MAGSTCQISSHDSEAPISSAAHCLFFYPTQQSYFNFEDMSAKCPVWNNGTLCLFVYYVLGEKVFNSQLNCNCMGAFLTAVVMHSGGSSSVILILTQTSSRVISKAVI